MSVNNNKGTNNDVTKETKKCEKKKKKELDRILDSALDDLSDDDEEDEVQTQTHPPKNNQSTTSTSSRNQQEKEEEMLAASLEEMMKSFMETMKQNDDAGTSSSSSGHHDDDDDRIHQDLTKALQQIDEQMKMAMSLQENDPKENMTVETNNKSASKGKKKKKNVEEVDKTVAKILNDMAKAGAAVPDNHVGGMEPAQVEAMGEEIMQEMMKEFEHMGQKGDSDQVVNGMMHQLLDKEIMYEPMKQVNDKFPEWLAKNKPYLSKTDYERYGHQYQGFQRIVHVYENDPNNIPRLMELMQDIQEYGQPPAEIVQELAPDLEFDSEGMPKMDPSAMPFPGGNEQCPMM